MSQRQAAKVLGVSKGTIQNDFYKSCPPNGQILSAYAAGSETFLVRSAQIRDHTNRDGSFDLFDLFQMR
jgi:transposase